MHAGKNNSKKSKTNAVSCCMLITQSRGHVEREVKRGSKTESKAGTVRHPAQHYRNFPMIALEEVCSRARSSFTAAHGALAGHSPSPAHSSQPYYQCDQ